MCSIFASHKKDILSELADLNQYRGNFSYSITEISNKVESQIKEFGIFNKDNIHYNNLFKICHVQAPTGGLVEDIDRIHPVEYSNTLLWHNGIITPRGIKFLQEKLNTTETFDTKLLSLALYNFGWCILNEIEGLFACVYYKDGCLFLFRTKHGKLYIDNVNEDDIIISSERYKDTKCINFDTVYHLDISNNSLKEISKFKTLKFNIIVKGEI